jgi:hypothetical protein
MRYRAIRGCLILAVLLSAPAPSSAEPQHQKQAPQVEISQKTESAAKSQPNGQNNAASPEKAAPGVIHETKDSEKISDCCTKKSTDEASEYWTFLIFGAHLKITDSLLALFTFVLIFVGIGQGYFLARTDKSTRIVADAAKLSADISNKTLIISNRPLIKVDVKFNNGITLQDDMSSFSFMFAIENIGKSTPKNIYQDIVIEGPTRGDLNVFNPQLILERTIEWSKQANVPFGFTVFPGDKIEKQIAVIVKKDKLDSITDGDGVIMPVLIGAFFYRSDLTGDIHATGFIYDIYRYFDVPPGTPEYANVPAPIIRKIGDIPQSELRLVRSSIFPGYAD